MIILGGFFTPIIHITFKLSIKSHCYSKISKRIAESGRIAKFIFQNAIFILFQTEINPENLPGVI